MNQSCRNEMMNKHLRILYATTDASIQSGACLHMLDTARDTARQGYQVLAILPAGGAAVDLFRDAGLDPIVTKITRAKRSYLSAQSLIEYFFGFPVEVVELVRILRIHRPDVVHINEIFDVQPGLAAKLCRIPIVWHIRADLESPTWARTLLAWLVKSCATQILTVSQSAARRVFGESFPSNLRVLHDPAYLSLRFPGERRGDISDKANGRNALGIPFSVPLVGLVSKLHRVKGHEYLIRAIPQILKGCPDAMFVIVGGPIEGLRDDAEFLQSLPKLLGIRDRVVFTGYRPDVSRLISTCDVMVHCPYWEDPFPRVVMEAMALGKPVVATKVGGIPEQVENGVSGILVPPRDENALAQAIVRLLSNHTLRESMSLRAWKRAREVFSPVDYNATLHHIYSSLAEPGQTH